MSDGDESKTNPIGTSIHIAEVTDFRPEGVYHTTFSATGTPSTIFTPRAALDEFFVMISKASRDG